MANKKQRVSEDGEQTTSGDPFRPKTFIGRFPIGEKFVRVYADPSPDHFRGGFLDLSKPRYYRWMEKFPEWHSIITGYHYIPKTDAINGFRNEDPNHDIFYFIDSEGYLQVSEGADITNQFSARDLPLYQRGLQFAQPYRDIEKEKEEAVERGHPTFFSSQQTMSLKSKNPSLSAEEGENKQDILDDQTNSAAKVSLKATKPDLAHVKTGFVLKKDNLLSKSFLIQHTYSFLEKYIFNNAILKTDVYKTVPTVLETISEKAGISVQAHEELPNVDVHMMSHKSVFLQVYVVGHEKVSQNVENKGLFSKLKGAFSSSSGTQITESKDYGLKKSELISASLLEGVPLIGTKSVTPTSAYSRILQFYEGKSLVFQSKFPSQDLVQSNNEPFLVFYLNQRVYETSDGGHTAVRSVRDPTTGRQINLEDIDGYWLLCFGRSRLLYIIKANIAPREEYTGREVSTPNPPPSDQPPPLPQTKSHALKKKMELERVSQTSSSGSTKNSSFLAQSSDFDPENTDSEKGKGHHDDDRQFDRRLIDLYRVSNAIVDKHDKHFSVISKNFFNKIMSRVGTFYLTNDYVLKSQTKATEIPDLTVLKLIDLLFPGEDASQVFAAVKGETGSALDDKNNVIKEYFTNTSDGNSEQLSAALTETHVIQMDYGLQLKMIEFLMDVSPTFHTLSIMGIFNILGKNPTKEHSHEVLSQITDNTFYKKYFLESIGKSKKLPQHGVDESELMTYFSSEEQFMRFTNYATFLLLFDVFVEITKKMGDCVKSCLLSMETVQIGMVQFVKQSVLKTMFCFPEFYLQEMSLVDEHDSSPPSSSHSSNKEGLKILKDHIMNQRNETLKDLRDVGDFELLNRPQITTNETIAVQSCLDILSFMSFSSKKVILSLDKSKQMSFKVFKDEVVEISLQGEHDDENEMENKIMSTGSEPAASQEQILQDNILTSSAKTISKKWGFVLDESTESRSFMESEMRRTEEYEKHRISGRTLLSESQNNQYSNPPMIYNDVSEILGSGPDKISKNNTAIIREQLVKMRHLASLRLIIITCLRSLVLTGKFIGNEKYSCRNVIKCFNESVPYFNELMTKTCLVNAFAEDLMLHHNATFENFDTIQETLMRKIGKYVSEVTGDIAPNLFL